MNEPPLNLGGPRHHNGHAHLFSPDMTPWPDTAPVNPTWRISVQVDFQAALGAFKSLLPAGTGGKVRYTATVRPNAP